MMPLLTAVYSVIGLIYFDWGVFHIVYLFWFENFVKIIAYRFKIAAVDYVSISGITQKTKDQNGKILSIITNVFYSRIAMYFVYFVFIVVGLGFILAFLETDKDLRIKNLYQFFSVFSFRDWEFNLALLSCILDELMTYFRDFRQKKIYNIKHPYPLPKSFEKEDLVLHLSILFSGLFAFLVKHPESPVFGFISISPMLIAGTLLIVSNLSFQFFTVYKQSTVKLA